MIRLDFSEYFYIVFSHFSAWAHLSEQILKHDILKKAAKYHLEKTECATFNNKIIIYLFKQSIKSVLLLNQLISSLINRLLDRYHF